MRRQGVEKPSQGPSMLEQVKQDDVKRMAGDADVAEKAKSLRRMAFQNPDKAAEFTKQLVNDPSPALRAAAYEVAGSFAGEEWDRVVAQGLNDTELEVRIATLKGMNRQPSQTRAAMAEAHAAKAGADTKEKIWARMAVMKAASDTKVRAAKENEVLALVRRLERPVQGEVLIELYKIWPDRPELITIAEKVVGTGQETPDFMPSFRYLSAYAQENLATVLKSSAWPDSRAFLLDVVDFLIQKCPTDTAAIVARVEKHGQRDADVESKIKQMSSAGTCRAN